jgi:hypothetical protein
LDAAEGTSGIDDKQIQDKMGSERGGKDPVCRCELIYFVGGLFLFGVIGVFGDGVLEVWRWCTCRRRQRGCVYRSKWNGGFWGVMLNGAAKRAGVPMAFLLDGLWTRSAGALRGHEDSGGPR